MGAGGGHQEHEGGGEEIVDCGLSSPEASQHMFITPQDFRGGKTEFHSFLMLIYILSFCSVPFFPYSFIDSRH